MTKTVLLYESRKNNMGLPLEKLLGEYFTKEEVQNALWEIGERTTGTKEELVGDLIYNWDSHNRDNYDLLDFVEKETLENICYFYNLDGSKGNHSTLKKRIKKAKLLDSEEDLDTIVDRIHDSSIPKNKSKDDTGVTDVHFHISSVTQSKGGKIGIALTVIGIAVSIIVALVV